MRGLTKESKIKEIIIKDDKDLKRVLNMLQFTAKKYGYSIIDTYDFAKFVTKKSDLCIICYENEEISDYRIVILKWQ